MSQRIRKAGESGGADNLQDTSGGPELEAFLDAGVVLGLLEGFGDGAGANPDVTFEIVPASRMPNFDSASIESFHGDPSSSFSWGEGARAGPGGVQIDNINEINHVR